MAYYSIFATMWINSSHYKFWIICLSQMQVATIFNNESESDFDRVAEQNLEDIMNNWNTVFKDMNHFMTSILTDSDFSAYTLNDFKAAAYISKFCIGLAHDTKYFPVDGLLDEIKRRWHEESPSTLKRQRDDDRRHDDKQKSEKKRKKPFPPIAGHGKVLNINAQKQFG